MAQGTRNKQQQQQQQQQQRSSTQTVAYEMQNPKTTQEIQASVFDVMNQAAMVYSYKKDEEEAE